MLVWLWNFMVYSFIGFLLEVAFARLVGGRADRKGLLVLPLCPVYGAGACLILALPAWAVRQPWALFLLGSLAATAAEYLAALYHEKALGVSFWNYDGLPGNIQGKVCLPFSLAWGMLSLGLVYWLHPLLSPWLVRIPPLVGWLALATLLTDGCLTAAMLRRCGDVSCLRWYSRAN
ncbi:putative ABC transporter permease [Flintibacter muris]|uniref:putative ABC transporter permease n=1 Tax=Flintibacter muris TaxID=2941327 RepID=UPI00204126E8|nr:putative ABC transporter permease [Flintibacter muris]